MIFRKNKNGTKISLNLKVIKSGEIVSTFILSAAVFDMVATRHMRLSRFKLILKIKNQFATISRAQQPYVASGYFIWKYEKFPSLQKLYQITLPEGSTIN